MRPGSRLLSHVNVMYKKKSPPVNRFSPQTETVRRALGVFSIEVHLPRTEWISSWVAGKLTAGLLQLGSDGLNFNLISFPLAFD